MLEGVSLCPPLCIAPKYEDWSQTQPFCVWGKSFSGSAESFFLATTISHGQWKNAWALPIPLKTCRIAEEAEVSPGWEAGFASGWMDTRLFCWCHGQYKPWGPKSLAKLAAVREDEQGGTIGSVIAGRRSLHLEISLQMSILVQYKN